VRAEETLDMLQAMNTGHDGSLTTIHANSPRDAIARMETMAMMANLNLPEKAIRQQIASAVAIIIQISRMSDGTRRITHFSEITGMSEEVVSLQDIFRFEKRGLGPNNKVLGRFHSTGIVPKFLEKLKTSGIEVSMDIYNHSVDV
jgi:pilus assembly protein CpaF